jgi:hypothetical protein
VGSGTLSLSFSVDVGNLKLSNGATSFGTTVGISGTVAEINAIIHTAGVLQYKGPLNVNGNNAATLTFQAKDFCATCGSGGTAVIFGSSFIDINSAQPELIFQNSFEDIVIFKALSSQFEYDFSKVSVTDLDENPLLIAKGLDQLQKAVILIYLRNDLGQLQIRMDELNPHNQAANLWTVGQWQSIDNNKNTLIQWNHSERSEK